tara:strand:- start:14459 stop:15598 length:1140 start_codon:yes stop_codon:yes gene_type:complete
MKYCNNCLMPETKPDLAFDQNGKCSACVAFEQRNSINWDSREKELDEIFKKFKQNLHWDCVVPVSGGKDSTFQVLKVLEYGLKPLCVTSTTCDLSDLGRKNIENIKSFGIDYIEFTSNKKIRKKLNKIGLEEIGDIAWPEHVGIFTIPVIAAVKFNIPLIVWGENSQNEYGGPLSKINNNILDRSWLEEFGGLLGLRVTDLHNAYGIEKKDLLPYIYPSDEELKKANITGIFLGHYIEWDGSKNAEIASLNGFKSYNTIVEGTATPYENLDNYQHGIHDYFKYIKYGFSRATDQVCMAIRRKKITRKDGIDIIKKYDGKYPNIYLGKKLEDIIKEIGIDKNHFDNICDQFTNKKLFKLDNKKKPLKDKDGNLIPLFEIE